MSLGFKFREALKKETPLQLLGVTNAYTAMMAEKSGFSALYLSGAGVANNSNGFPDLGLIHLGDVLIDLNRIASATSLPVIVDIDTGFGNLLMLQRTIKELESHNAAGVHLEDQVFDKRCGHRDGKELVSSQDMVQKITISLETRKNDDFFVIARTDALSVEGFEKSIERAKLYAKAGADAIFAEAFTSLDQYKELKENVKIPILANQTEFGKTPLFSLEELKGAGVDIVLYPLSISRAMNQAALRTMHAIKEQGTQKSVIEHMQTRQELYNFLNYEHYEHLQDKFRKLQ